MDDGVLQVTPVEYQVLQGIGHSPTASLAWDSFVTEVAREMGVNVDNLCPIELVIEGVNPLT